MALLYRIYKNNNTKSSTFGKYYARATYVGEVNTNDLAEKISYSTTATKADCKVVLEALVEAMNDALQASQSVKLDGFGIFKLGISSKGANAPEEYMAQKHIKGVHVNFQPCWVGSRISGERKTTFKNNLKVQEATHNEY